MVIRNRLHHCALDIYSTVQRVDDVHRSEYDGHTDTREWMGNFDKPARSHPVPTRDTFVGSFSPHSNRVPIATGNTVRKRVCNQTLSKEIHG